MIDLKTGIIEFGEVRITPYTTIEELEKYGKNAVSLNKFGDNCAVARLSQKVTNNDFSAEIKITIDEDVNTRKITITPSLKGKETMGRLDASKEWLKGMTVGGTYTEDDLSICGSYDWGTMVAMYHDDRDYGTVGGEINIRYKVE